MRTAAAVLVFLAAASAHAGKPKAPYVGVKIGLDVPERSTKVKLPRGLVYLGSVHTTDAHVVRARRANDLVLLLVGDDGVVLDSVEIGGAAADRELVPGCEAGSEDVLIALVPASPKSGRVTAIQAWNSAAGKLTAVSGEVTCDRFEIPDTPSR